MAEVAEWGVQYPGEPEPRLAVDGEWRARSWADYWNTHQIGIDEGPATVVTRMVVTSDWTTPPTATSDPAGTSEQEKADG